VLRTPPNGLPEVVIKKELGLCGFGGDRARSEEEGEETTKFIAFPVSIQNGINKTISHNRPFQKIYINTTTNRFVVSTSLLYSFSFLLFYNSLYRFNLKCLCIQQKRTKKAKNSLLFFFIIIIILFF
jgi:hypothetical protein